VLSFDVPGDEFAEDVVTVAYMTIDIVIRLDKGRLAPTILWNEISEQSVRGTSVQKMDFQGSTYHPSHTSTFSLQE
jgi:hypothetical protein